MPENPGMKHAHNSACNSSSRLSYCDTIIFLPSYDRVNDMCKRPFTRLCASGGRNFCNPSSKHVCMLNDGLNGPSECERASFTTRKKSDVISPVQKKKKRKKNNDKTFISESVHVWLKYVWPKQSGAKRNEKQKKMREKSPRCKLNSLIAGCHCHIKKVNARMKNVNGGLAGIWLHFLICFFSSLSSSYGFLLYVFAFRTNQTVAMDYDMQTVNFMLVQNKCGVRNSHPQHMYVQRAYIHLFV